MNKKWKVWTSAIECPPPPLLVFRAHSFKFHQGLSKKWLLQDMYGTWQRPTRTLKTNENVVRERQHTRNRFFLAGTEFCELGQGHGNHLLDTPWLRFCFFCCWFRLHAGPSLNTHERNIKSVSHSNLFLIFENISTKVITNLCFFRIIFGRDCPGSSAGQILFEKIPMGFKMDLLVIGSQDARNSSKRVRRKHESR